MMFSTLRFHFLLVAILLLPSCAYLQKTTPDSLNSKIDHWLAHNQFGRIEKALNRIDPKQEEYVRILKRKSEVSSKKQSYIKTTQNKAKKYLKQNQWQLAINTYIEALNNIDQEPALTRDLTQVIADRDHQISLLKIKLLIENANTLLSYDPIYNQLHNLAPKDNAAIRDIQKHHRNRKIVAGHLEKCGRESYQNSQLNTAHDCYTLSNKLIASEQKLYWVNKINTQIQNKNNHERYNQLLAAYKLAYDQKAYNQAKLHLDSLLSINPEHKQAKEYSESLNAEINKLVDIKIERGKTLYSQKKIDEALKVWMQAKKLSPNNEKLNQLITRAKKVTKKIESLEHSQ